MPIGSHWRDTFRIVVMVMYIEETSSRGAVKTPKAKVTSHNKKCGKVEA